MLGGLDVGGTEEGLPIQTKNTKLTEQQVRDISVSAFLDF
jgi:hypothetical protein